MAKILVIDDDEMFRTLYEELLVDEGHKVFLANNGKMGIESARSNGPDLILMDLNMPGMDGYEAIRQLRADDLSKNTPILVITSSQTPGEYDEIYNAGGSGYVSKPINADLLKKRIAGMLAK